MASIGRTSPMVPLPQDLLQYIPDYRVVICVSCRYAVQPNAISRHLKEIHQILRSNRRPFMQYVAKLHLDEPEIVIQSKVHKFPIPLLPVLDGLACKHRGCHHLCASVKRMKSHWVSTHGRLGQELFDWNHAPLQTFFRGNLLRYFTKSPPDIYCPKPILSFIHERDDRDNIIQYTSKDCEKQLPSIGIQQYNIVLNEVDTALLQHYTLSTSKTIATDAETVNLWQATVPEIAQKCPFLMHGILACSALHLAYSEPEQEQTHIIRAATHQNHAMPLFRSAIANPNDENCYAILAFSHLLVIYSFASEKQDDRLFLVAPDGLEVLPSWLYFLRAGCEMLCSVWHQLETGPVRALVSAWEVPIIISDDSKASLVDYFFSIIPSRSSEDAWTEEECKIYRDAAVELELAFSCTRALGQTFTTWDALRIWPIRISVDYMNLLGTRHPGALILLAHYCILLQKLEPQWYFEGRASSLLSNVLSYLDTKWYSHIKWPLKEVGSPPMS